MQLSRPQPQALTKAVLDRFVAESDAVALAAADPVALVRAYVSPDDQEVAGLLVSALAYGRVASIKASAGALLGQLGPHPAQAVDAGEAERIASGFVYRFQRGEDLPAFLRAMRRLRAEHGSLAAAFVAGDPGGEDYADAIDALSLALRARAEHDSRGLRFLLPRAGDTGGAAKRPCLYLRWMVRPHGPQDLGAWRTLTGERVDAARLLVPLDTHIERIARYIGLTDRKSGGLATARDITAALRRLRPEDPLYYDLALCHLGIAGRCPRRRQLEACRECPIRSLCRLGPTPRGWHGHSGGQRATRLPRVRDP